MGIIISRFRKKATTKELLENIEQEIQTIEDHKWSTIRNQKNILGFLFFSSGFAYVTLALFLYFYYLPRSVGWKEKLFHALPLVVLPLIVYTFKKSLQWYYRWDIDRQEDKLKDLKRQKRKILSKIMETETYVVAKEILEKYDPSALQSKTSSPSPGDTSSSNLRYRNVAGTPLPSRGGGMSMALTQIRTPGPGVGQRPAQMFTPGAQMTPRMAMPMRQSLPPPARLSRPVLPQYRGVVEKLVDYVVGDGPTNRYALICKACQSHNGMALKDEFEYVGFRCCYCYFLNAPRKLRPYSQGLVSAPSSARPSLAPVIDEPESETDRKDGNISSDDSSVNIVDISSKEKRNCGGDEKDEIGTDINQLNLTDETLPTDSCGRDGKSEISEESGSQNLDDESVKKENLSDDLVLL